MIGTANLAIDARDGQAALVVGHEVVGLLHDHRVDEDVGVVILLGGVLGVHDGELDGLAHLRGGQATAAVLEHLDLHALNQGAKVGIDLLDLGALLAQTRVRRQNDTVDLHGLPFERGRKPARIHRVL